MDIALISADPSEELTRALALAGITVTAVPDVDDGQAWSLAIIELGEDPLRGLRIGRRLEEESGLPIMVVADTSQIGLLESEGWMRDFISRPLEPLELRLRVGRLTVQADDHDVVRYKSLELNLATYQATVEGRPVDLTYMEYELLRFFVENPGRVWSREQLLQKVWGYDYFGGARTVDVHVRRLRAKLGEERASWIATVRSVGYRFG
jgi:DNA-binding response OmpR family regulator